MRKVCEDEGGSDIEGGDQNCSSSSLDHSSGGGGVGNCCSGGGGGGTLKMHAKAILTCRPNSHPFQERALSLDQPAKIGRSVARARPAGNNAIFDCKVLSRNHALLWHENGKFYLQDTKSSNGTFVNNQRLSKSSEESAPREVCSGDIVQFGVDVMEVNKKLTHGCIVATLQLFLPDGKEAKASSSTSTLPDKASNAPLHDVYLLSQFMKEAMQKEQMIEHKLAAVTKLAMATKEAMNSSWKTMIEEDRLLTRIDILERQVETSHKSVTDEKLRDEVTQLYHDKEKYQSSAKETLQKMSDQKMDMMEKYNEIEKNMQNFLHEKELYKQVSDQRSEELRDLAEKYEKAEHKSQELEDEIVRQTAKYKEDLQELNAKLEEGQKLLQEKQTVLEALISKMDPKVAKSILSQHNDTSAIIFPENDSNELAVDEASVAKTKLSNENIANNKTDDNLNINAVASDVEKKELKAKLSQMLGFFEDLKTVSNNIQTTEHISELVGKVDTEMHQIKNLISGEESIKISNNITEKINEINAENHLKWLSSETNGVEKLLQESRDTIKGLQLDLTSIKQQNEKLQEQYNECVANLEVEKTLLASASGSSSQLKSQVSFLEEQLANMGSCEEESRDKLRGYQDVLESKDKLISSLESEIRALKKSVEENSTVSHRLNDLKNRNPEQAALEVACQTLHDSLESTSSDVPNSSLSVLNSSVTSYSSEAESLKERLLSTEEELAVYKHRFSESSEECAKLARECITLKGKNGSVSDQPKLPLHYIIPVIILILAILIGFHPSS